MSDMLQLVVVISLIQYAVSRALFVPGQIETNPNNRQAEAYRTFG